MKIVLCAIIAAFFFNNSSIASGLFLNCIITDEITDTGFFEVNSTFKLETDGASVLTIHLPPDGSITLNQYFDAYMGHIYAHEFNNLTSKSAFLQKDIFSPKKNKNWYFKYIVIRINQLIGFEANCTDI
ncbi:hypothetical protein OAS27_03270 [Alphaproteobacteria bacterium]|nr:hypothetical protein [Alphaproteobacteria bacterium]